MPVFDVWCVDIVCVCVMCGGVCMCFVQCVVVCMCVCDVRWGVRVMYDVWWHVHVCVCFVRCAVACCHVYVNMEYIVLHGDASTNQYSYKASDD